MAAATRWFKLPHLLHVYTKLYQYFMRIYTTYRECLHFPIFKLPTHWTKTNGYLHHLQLHAKVCFVKVIRYVGIFVVVLLIAFVFYSIQKNPNSNYYHQIILIASIVHSLYSMYFSLYYYNIWEGTTAYYYSEKITIHKKL